MTTIRAMVTLPMDTGAASDSVVNTWHFVTVTDAPSTLDGISNALSTFYSSLNSILSQNINHSAVSIRFYSLEQAKPRPPIYTKNISITSPSPAVVLPPELAICLSFQATRQAGVNQARRRGRIFIGPLNINAQNAGNIDTTKVTLVKDAGLALLTASRSSVEWEWVTSSATFAATPYTNPVDNGWVDNAFDIQRRRGWDASVRSTFT